MPGNSRDLPPLTWRGREWVCEVGHPAFELWLGWNEMRVTWSLVRLPQPSGRVHCKHPLNASWPPAMIQSGIFTFPYLVGSYEDRARLFPSRIRHVQILLRRPALYRDIVLIQIPFSPEWTQEEPVIHAWRVPSNVKPPTHLHHL